MCVFKMTGYRLCEVTGLSFNLKKVWRREQRFIKRGRGHIRFSKVHIIIYNNTSDVNININKYFGGNGGDINPHIGVNN